MEIIYRSIDNELFTTEKECLEHEKIFKNNSILLDSDLNPTDTFENCYFICAKTDKAAKWIYETFKGQDLTPWDDSDKPCAGNWFFYDCNWYNFEEFRDLIIPFMAFLEEREEDRSKKSIEQIRNICKRYPSCIKCPFYLNSDEGCVFQTGRAPIDWDLNS